MSYRNINTMPYESSKGGKYYPKLDVWVWDGVDEAIQEGAITEPQFDTMIELAISVAKLCCKQEDHNHASQKQGGQLTTSSYIEEFLVETQALIATIERIMNKKVFKENSFYENYLSSILLELKTEKGVFRKQSFEGKGFIENSIVTENYVNRVKTYILGKYKDVTENKSRISFINILVVAGSNAQMPTIGQDLLKDREISQQFGKQMFMYSNIILFRAHNIYLPYKRKYFVYSLATEDEFINGGLCHNLNFEIGHNAERFTSVQWLEDMKSTLIGLNAVAGLDTQGLLGALGTSRNGIYEIVIANHLDLYTDSGEGISKPYYFGENIMLNCWVNSGAIKIHFLSDGTKFEIDYDKMEIVIGELTDELLDLQDKQNLDDFESKVEYFKSKYFDEQVFVNLEIVTVKA